MTKFVGKRQYIMEGPLQKARGNRKLYGYLFNDMLILCEQLRNTSKGYKYTLYRPVRHFILILSNECGTTNINYQYYDN